MKMHCFAQNVSLGFLEHSGKCVINEGIVMFQVLLNDCSLFCWSQEKLAEPVDSLWCSKHDLFPCESSKEYIYLLAAVSCLLQKIRLNCTCVVPDACGVYPVNPNRHAVMRTGSAFSSHFSYGSRETLIAEIAIGGKYPCEIPYSKPHKVNKRKSHLCICLTSPAFPPHLVTVQKLKLEQFHGIFISFAHKSIVSLCVRRAELLFLVKCAEVGSSIY